MQVQPAPLHGRHQATYAKNEQDIGILIHLTLVFSSYIDMTFGLAKCRHLIVNRSVVKSTSGISPPDGRRDDIDESYKYLLQYVRRFVIEYTVSVTKSLM